MCSSLRRRAAGSTPRLDAEDDWNGPRAGSGIQGRKLAGSKNAIRRSAGTASSSGGPFSIAMAPIDVRSTVVAALRCRENALGARRQCCDDFADAAGVD